jgi:hypothetical protein
MQPLQVVQEVISMVARIPPNPIGSQTGVDVDEPQVKIFPVGSGAGIR